MGKRVITVGRQYGSNGRVLAKELSERLGVRFYDKELIHLAGEKSNIPYENLLKVDEKRAAKWYYPVGDEKQMEGRFRFEPMNDVLFQTQRDIILELAEREDCVIVGRCAGHVLKDYEGCMSVFVHAPFIHRVKAIMERADIELKDAQALVKKLDKQRRYYYNYYTDCSWDDMNQYDLCLNTSSFRKEQMLQILEGAYRSI